MTKRWEKRTVPRFYCGGCGKVLPVDSIYYEIYMLDALYSFCVSCKEKRSSGNEQEES